MSTESVSLSDCHGEVQAADWSQSSQLGDRWRGQTPLGQQPIRFTDTLMHSSTGRKNPLNTQVHAGRGVPLVETASDRKSFLVLCNFTVFRQIKPAPNSISNSSAGSVLSRRTFSIVLLHSHKSIKENKRKFQSCRCV